MLRTKNNSNHLKNTLKGLIFSISKLVIIQKPKQCSTDKRKKYIHHREMIGHAEVNSYIYKGAKATQ